MELTELTPTEEQAYIDTVGVEKEKAKPEAETIKEKRIRVEVPKLAKIQNITSGKAEEILRSRANGVLEKKDVIHFKSFGQVPVSSVLDDPEKYNKQYCADPLEQEEGTSKALFFSNEDTGTPLIHSMLHGGQDYWLKHSTDIVPEGYRTTQLSSGKTKSEVILRLTEASTPEGIATELWCEIVASAKLNHTDRDAVLSHLASSLGIKKTLLKREYQDFRGRTWAEESFEELREKAGHRELIEFLDYDLNKATEAAEMAILNVPGKWLYFSYGGVLSYSTYDSPTNRALSVDGEKAPMIPVIKQYNRDSLCLRAEQSVFHYKLKEDKASGIETATLIPTPSSLINKLMEHPDPLAPKVSGLVPHPIITLDGRIIAKEGIDEETGLLLQYGGTNFMPIPTKLTVDLAKNAANRVLESLFGEFLFKKSPTHEDLYMMAALAMLMTGLFRKVLEQAPAFSIVANIQGSGKTTLARIIYNTLTGRDMPVSSLGGGSEEMKKEMLAMLMQSPAMVCYDNILDGSEINDPVLAKVITAQVYKGRILGKTQEATVPTNTMIAITGNNITLSADLVRRFITIRLTADSSQPETRAYKHPEIVQHCLKLRRHIIHDCLLITKAYIDAGSPISSGKVDKSGFHHWDTMVRFPLLWATGVDVLDSMKENRQQSTEYMAMGKVLNCLSDLFGTDFFTASRLMAVLTNDDGDPDEVVDSLKEGLISMSSRSVRSPKSLTWVLKKLEGRIFDNLVLHKEYIRNRADEYRVENI